VQGLLLRDSKYVLLLIDDALAPGCFLAHELLSTDSLNAVDVCREALDPLGVLRPLALSALSLLTLSLSPSPSSSLPLSPTFSSLSLSLSLPPPPFPSSLSLSQHTRLREACGYFVFFILFFTQEAIAICFVYLAARSCVLARGRACIGRGGRDQRQAGLDSEQRWAPHDALRRV